jgi:hypothetical protein
MHLVIILISLLIHHIEESELVDTLACSHNSQPVTQLLLLEEFFRPGISLAPIPNNPNIHRSP